MATKLMSRKSREDIIVDLFVIVFSVILMLVTLYPFLNVLAISFNDSNDTLRGGITIFPRVFTTAAYKDILSNRTVYSALVISILRTVIGTVSHLICVLFVGYLLSRKDFLLVKPLTIIMTITMYVGGGLIPFYFVLRSLGLINNFLVYIVPSLFIPFHILIVRTYIYGIPISLQESAKIDGASDFQIILRIILPLVVPVLATVALFQAVGNWNNWFDTYIFASGNKNLQTLQFVLMEKLASAQMKMSQSMADALADVESKSNLVTPQSIRAAMTIVATFPIICTYPFLQKYFVSGLVLGGVKG